MGIFSFNGVQSRHLRSQMPITESIEIMPESCWRFQFNYSDKPVWNGKENSQFVEREGQSQKWNAIR